MRWFAHDPERFDEFRARYRRELAGRRDRVRELGERASSGPVTLVTPPVMSSTTTPWRSPTSCATRCTRRFGPAA
jgi:uncharacterized protein YeaO (DUF488 family)